MTPLLLLAGAVSLVWAIVLLLFRFPYGGPAVGPPMMDSLAHNLGITHLVLGALFLYAARDPVANRGAIYAGILLSALKMINDAYDVVVLLPPDQALVSLADLVLSVGLCVGLLEALPRTLGRGAAPPAAD